MKIHRFLKSGSLGLLVLFAGNANALIIDFENFATTPNFNLASTFFNSNTNTGSLETLTQAGLGFGTGSAITFSGGVLLQNPTDTMEFGNTGSVLYGTANSPTTGATTNPNNDALPRTITINIRPDAPMNPGENVTLVEGFLANGLNTDRIDGATGMLFTDELADYMVSFFTTDENTPEFEWTMENLVSNQLGGFAIFSFNSENEGDGVGNNITKVEITSPGIQFLGPNSDFEWDFLIDTLSFNEALPNPVPVPAALPLFLSALLGGWVFARPRKPSESKH